MQRCVARHTARGACGRLMGAMPMHPLPRPHRVLIVEDSRYAGDRLSLFFTRMGYSVCKVRSAGDAVALCDHFPPDVAVVDVSGLDGTGYELARYIREKRARAVLIVATGAQGFEPDHERSHRSGIDHHFVKTADLDMLLTFVDQRRPAEPSKDAEG